MSRELQLYSAVLCWYVTNTQSFHFQPSSPRNKSDGYRTVRFFRITIFDLNWLIGCITNLTEILAPWKWGGRSYTWYRQFLQGTWVPKTCFPSLKEKNERKDLHFWIWKNVCAHSGIRNILSELIQYRWGLLAMLYIKYTRSHILGSIQLSLSLFLHPFILSCYFISPQLTRSPNLPVSSFNCPEIREGGEVIVRDNILHNQC